MKKPIAAIAAIVCAFAFLCSLPVRATGADAVVGVPVIDAEAVDLHDEIDFLEELTFDNRDARRYEIEELYQKCNAYMVDHDVKATDIALYITNYYVLLDMREKLEYYDAAAIGGVLAEIEMPAEVDPGDEAVLKLHLRNLKNTPASGSYEVEYRRAVLEAKDAVTGDYSLNASEEKTVEIRFTALEGSYSIVKVNFRKADGSALSTDQTSLFVTPPGFYFADVHTHSNISDAAPSLPENMRYALRHGLNILYATDHNAYTESRADLLAAHTAIQNGMSEKFLHLKGSELTDYNGGKGHSVYHNPVKHFETPSTTDDYLKLIDNVVAQGSTFYVAHPFDFGSNGFKPLDEFRVEESIDDFLALFYHHYGNEVMSYWQYDDTSSNVTKYRTRTLPALQLWDKSNIRGYKKYFGLANSDAHWTSALGMNKNGMYLEEFTENRVNNAIATGGFYLTNGPELRFTLDGKTNGQSVIAEGAKQAPVVIKAYATTSPLTKVTLVKYRLNSDYNAGYAAAERTVLFDETDPKWRDNAAELQRNKQTFAYNDTLTVEPDTFYRVEVLAETTEQLVRQAYSNPVWITEAATEFALDKTEITLKPGESTKLNFVTDNVYDSAIVTSSDKNAVEVLDNGFVKAAEGASGSYTVTARTESGLTATCKVTVEGAAPAPEEKEKGCGSTADASSACSVALLAAALFAVTRKNGKENKKIGG